MSAGTVCVTVFSLSKVRRGTQTAATPLCCLHDAPLLVVCSAGLQQRRPPRHLKPTLPPSLPWAVDDGHLPFHACYSSQCICPPSRHLPPASAPVPQRCSDRISTLPLYPSLRSNHESWGLLPQQQQQHLRDRIAPTLHTCIRLDMRSHSPSTLGSRTANLVVSCLGPTAFWVAVRNNSKLPS